MTLPVLIEGGELEAQLGDPGLCVIDCRFVLGDAGAGARLFAEEHIAGASFIDVDDGLADPPAAAGPHGPVGGRHPLPSRERLEGALRRAGLRNGQRVAAYDQNMTGGAARLWWLLRHYGLDEIRVLRGGIAGWRGPCGSGPPAGRQGDVTLGLERDDVVDANEVATTDAIVLDARAPERYRGDVEPVDPIGGHIPGARNVPFSEAFERAPELAAEGSSVIVSCGSGVTACVLALALADAGHDDVQLYAGSWSDWVAQGKPVETGDPRRIRRKRG